MNRLMPLARSRSGDMFTSSMPIERRTKSELTPVCANSSQRAANASSWRMVIAAGVADIRQVAKAALLISFALALPP